MLYFDNNATTQPFPECLKILAESSWYNAHSTHYGGKMAEKDITEAKTIIAKYIDCDINEIYFVNSATEACNWAIQILRDKKCKFIYHKYEHSAVLKPIMAYPEVENPERNGYVQMLANNIYGEIYDIPQRENKNDLIFCDGTAAIGHMPFSFKNSGIDLLAFGAHKFNGLKGAACLIIKKDLLPVRSLLWGGDVTGGTPCSALIKAMAIALKKNLDLLEVNYKKNCEMRDYLITELLSMPAVHLNGPVGDKRMSNNVNISFSFLNGHDVQNFLSDRQVCVSTGSACGSDSFVEKRGGICVRPSNKNNIREPELVTIFKAGGLDNPEGSIRITLDANYNTLDECKQLISAIKEAYDWFDIF